MTLTTEHFRKQADSLNRATMHLSMTKEHYPEFQQVLAWGKEAVPYLLQDIKNEQGPVWHWFLALRRITGEWPAKEEDAGRFDSIRNAWLKWGQERGIKLSGTPTPPRRTIWQNIKLILSKR